MQNFSKSFKNRRVLVTGHTGFKGGWLCQWLLQLGAEVTGVSLPVESGPSFFNATGLADQMDNRIADIRDGAALSKAIEDVDAEVVIHMAAQSLVRLSYDTPVETFQTNVIGTANVLECARRMKSLRAVIVVTSDKCYDNKEWHWGYRENDPMGGSDPYSASKGCTELLTASYRNSFFSDASGPTLASVRAGNVFGGGDWAADRLIPDIIRATFAGQTTSIRNPSSIRPWQHVLEPLSGYLTLAAHLLEHGHDYAEGWNFGPDNSGVVDVQVLAELLQSAWGKGGPKFAFGGRKDDPHEAKILKLDSTQAITRLGWKPKFDLRQAVSKTTEWYKAYLADQDMNLFTQKQIKSYQEINTPV